VTLYLQQVVASVLRQGRLHKHEDGIVGAYLDVAERFA
jgi:hypothetical protein